MIGRTIKMRMTFPHPGDQHLELCVGTLNGNWVVSTRNKGLGGHCWGNYFGADEKAATAYFHAECKRLLKNRLAQLDDAINYPDLYAHWSAPAYYVEGLPPEMHGENALA